MVNTESRDMIISDCHCTFNVQSEKTRDPFLRGRLATITSVVSLTLDGVGEIRAIFVVLVLVVILFYFYASRAVSKDSLQCAISNSAVYAFSLQLLQ